MARQLMASLPADILGVMPSEAGSEGTNCCYVPAIFPVFFFFFLKSYFQMTNVFFMTTPIYHF